MRIVPFSLVEDEVPFAVERFKVGLDTRSLVRLLLLVAPDEQRNLLFAAHLCHQRFEHLLEERVLQLVVLHVAIDIGLAPDKFKHPDIPVNKLRIERLCQESLDDVKPATQFATERNRLEGFAFLTLAFARCRVAIHHEELEFGECWNLAVCNVFEYLAHGNRVVEIFSLCRLFGYFGQCAVDVLFRVLFRPCGKTVFVADVHDVPGVGHFARPHHAAVLGDDVSAEDDQCRFGNGPCGIQRIFPPVPALLDDVRVLGILVRIKVIDQQHVGTYGLVSRTTRRLSGTQCAERDLPFCGEFILGP